MTTGFNSSLWTGKKAPIIQRYEWQGKMYETQTMDGKILRKSVFQDLNRDGIYSDYEVLQVEQYSYRKNGTLETKITYQDDDHDGYSDDNYIVDKYNEYGDPKSFIMKKNRSIEEMKANAKNGTCCDKTALNNRKMSSHKDGNDRNVCY